MFSSCPASWGSVRHLTSTIPGRAQPQMAKALQPPGNASLPIFPSSLLPQPASSPFCNFCPKPSPPDPRLRSPLSLPTCSSPCLPHPPLTWPLAFGLCCFGLLSRHLSWVGTARKQLFSCSDVALEESQTSRELKASPSGGSEERAAGLVAVLERLTLMDFHERQGRS